MLLAARWRKRLKRGPKLVAVTVDHGLRKESAKEAAAVARLAKTFGVAHRIARWSGVKPRSGIQEAARRMRYELLANEARRAGARLIAVAHTLDDQAETVLFRLARGSGLAGLGAMTPASPVPGTPDLLLLRPLLHVPKARLLATLRKDKIAFADDPSNRDPRFARPRLREVMPALEREGLSAERLALLSQRLRRADAAIEEVVARAMHAVSLSAWGEGTRVQFDPERLFALPDEVVLRLLGRAIARVGNEGPVELAKLESLCAAIVAERQSAGLRRTLAGALVILSRGRLVIEQAPARRTRGRRNLALTKRKTDTSKAARRP